MIAISIKLGFRVKLFKLFLYSVGTIIAHCLLLQNICFVKIFRILTWEALKYTTLFTYPRQKAYDSIYEETNYKEIAVKENISYYSKNIK